jgi:hypothetical protein
MAGRAGPANHAARIVTIPTRMNAIAISARIEVPIAIVALAAGRCASL